VDKTTEKRGIKTRETKTWKCEKCGKENEIRALYQQCDRCHRLKGFDYDWDIIKKSFFSNVSEAMTKRNDRIENRISELKVDGLNKNIWKSKN